MKFNGKSTIQNIKGDDITTTGKPDGETITVAQVCIRALLEEDETKKDLVGKLKRYTLAQKIDSGKCDTLTSEEISTIKQMAAKIYSVEVLGDLVNKLEEPLTP